MASIEERMQTLEQEHIELKKTVELLAIAIRALCDKGTLEELNEKYDKVFEALMAHNRLTNEQIETALAQILKRLPERP